MKWSITTILIALFFCLDGCKSKRRSLGEEHRRALHDLYSPSDRSDDVFHRRVLNTADGYDSYRLQNLRSVLGGLNAIIKATQDDYFIQQQISLINNIVNSARVSSEIPGNVSPFKDEYKGWVSLNRSRLYGEEIVLNEGYSFFYITEFLYYLKESGWISQSRENWIWWENKLMFVEEHIWEKWYNRSIAYHGNPHRYFLRGRTHMGAHWAGIAMYLTRITSDLDIQAQCDSLQQSYDLLLRRNLGPHPRDHAAYAWNSTYDDVTGTFAVKAEEILIQDVSHGNHVVSYIVAAYELGNNKWQRSDIKALCNTVKAIYNEKENRFADNVDGSEGKSRRGWGNFQADGWIKLSKYDATVSKVFHRFAEDGKMLRKYNQEFQFRSNFLEIK